jgi:poly(3-hydroxybutyrate) depolymerase
MLQNAIYILLNNTVCKLASALTEQVEDALIEDLVEAAAAVVAHSASRGSHFSANAVKEVLQYTWHKPSQLKRAWITDVQCVLHGCTGSKGGERFP